MELYDYEREHSERIRSSGAECTVLLKKDGAFPLDSPCRIALYGSGARRTVKGGTGSGEVNSRYFVTVEQGLKNVGFSVATEDWMDAYDAVKAEARADFLRERKAEARQRHQSVMMLPMGRTPAEPEYEIPLNGAGDTAVYVLSRICGEGTDRAQAQGDLFLTKTEIRDILTCSRQYARFMLVINAGGMVDLSPVQSVGNILVLSQLGAETGNILADILLGKQNPSGKLATTWASPDAFPQPGEFGEKDDTRYREGIYVGYRCFDSAGVEPLYPFGYGLSYTEFTLEHAQTEITGHRVTVRASVKNVGICPGKEVVQLYVSIPEGRLDEPFQVLCGFAKTGILAPGQVETVAVSFDMEDIAPYDAESAAYILEAGDYLLRLGNSSRNTQLCAAVRLEKTVTVLRARNVLGDPGFLDCRFSSEKKQIPTGVPVLELAADSFVTRYVNYNREEEIDPAVEALSAEQLIRMNVGAFDPKSAAAGMIGNAGFTVAGAAGQSCMDIPGIPSLVMADGPAGLRLSRRFAVDSKGKTHSLEVSLPESVIDLMPGLLRWGLNRMRYRPKKRDHVGEQYATAIPIGTAVAQSFNPALAEAFGKIVGDEMERFGVHLWLAPALNIHRNALCGRNFEYFSEDPLVSGIFAGALTRGVQSFPHAGVTIKHYACNNQEFNRTRNNSRLSERAAREIYLKGFGICVRTAQPKAVMTSYNLINGTHTSEHSGLITDILRCEYGFQGIVMTDWVIPGFGSEADCTHPEAAADHVCMAGGDLFMPGSLHDYRRIQKGLAEGTVTLRQLQVNAARVLRMAKALCK